MTAKITIIIFMISSYSSAAELPAVSQNSPKRRFRVQLLRYGIIVKGLQILGKFPVLVVHFKFANVVQDLQSF